MLLTRSRVPYRSSGQLALEPGCLRAAPFPAVQSTQCCVAAGYWYHLRCPTIGVATDVNCHPIGWGGVNVRRVCHTNLGTDARPRSGASCERLRDPRLGVLEDPTNDAYRYTSLGGRLPGWLRSSRCRRSRRHPVITDTYTSVAAATDQFLDTPAGRGLWVR